MVNYFVGGIKSPKADGTRACPGKVEAGFPKRTCDNLKNLEHIPIQPNRDVFYRPPDDIAMAKQADASLRAEFGLPLGLVTCAQAQKAPQSLSPRLQHSVLYDVALA